MAILEHEMMVMSTKKISPVARPLAEAGREAVYNNSWYMRNSNSIPHSTSRGLVASLFSRIGIVIVFLPAFAEPAGEFNTI